MAGKKKGGKKKPPVPKSNSDSTQNQIPNEHSSQIAPPTNSINLSPNENYNPNMKVQHVDELKHEPIKLLDQSGFKDWINNLKCEDISLNSKQLELLSQNVLEVQQNLSTLANLFGKKFKFNLMNSTNDAIKEVNKLLKCEWTPDFYSKGPLQLEYIQNRIMFTNLLKEASTKFEFMMAFILFNTSNTSLAIQEQLAIDKVGLEITNNLIKEESNLIFACQEDIKRLIKTNNVNLAPITSKLIEHEEAFKNLEIQIDKMLDEQFTSIKSNQDNYELLKLKTGERFIENEEKINKLFGLLRKANGRMNGIYHLCIPKNSNIPKNRSKSEDLKSRSSDSYEEIESDEENESKSYSNEDSSSDQI